MYSVLQISPLVSTISHATSMALEILLTLISSLWEGELLGMRWESEDKKIQLYGPHFPLCLRHESAHPNILNCGLRLFWEGTGAKTKLVGGRKHLDNRYPPLTDTEFWTTWASVCSRKICFIFEWNYYYSKVATLISMRTFSQVNMIRIAYLLFKNLKSMTNAKADNLKKNLVGRQSILHYLIKHLCQLKVLPGFFLNTVFSMSTFEDEKKGHTQKIKPSCIVKYIISTFLVFIKQSQHFYIFWGL